MGFVSEYRMIRFRHGIFRTGERRLGVFGAFQARILHFLRFVFVFSEFGGTNGVLLPDVPSLNGQEPGQGVDGLEDKFRGGIGVVEEGVELDAEEGDLGTEVSEVASFFEQYRLFRG